MMHTMLYMSSYILIYTTYSWEARHTLVKHIKNEIIHFRILFKTMAFEKPVQHHC